jgi:hypothetical protein
VNRRHLRLLWSEQTKGPEKNGKGSKFDHKEETKIEFLSLNRMQSI